MGAVSAPARRPPGRPSGGQPIADRDTLLDAAERVIARDGSGATLDAIALEAGVTKPIVYARVGSRAALSNALAERLADRLLVAAGELPSGPGFSRDGLAALFGTLLETLEEHRELFIYVTRGSGDDTPERTLFLAARSAAPLAEALAAWRTQLGADVEVATPWAYAIIGMINLTALWWMEDGHVPAPTLAGQLAELVWSGLGPRP
jgi:AcrR family transcriptional regulator